MESPWPDAGTNRPDKLSPDSSKLRTTPSPSSADTRDAAERGRDAADCGRDAVDCGLYLAGYADVGREEGARLKLLQCNDMSAISSGRAVTRTSDVCSMISSPASSSST